MSLDMKRRSAAPDVIAPDGSEVRVLAAGSRGGMALFTLAPGAVAKAVCHRTVEELWYVVSGVGRVWRKFADAERIDEVRPGCSLALPVGTEFQFRCDGAEPLTILGATMPPWPGDDEAYLVPGQWDATV